MTRTLSECLRYTENRPKNSWGTTTFRPEHRAGKYEFVPVGYLKQERRHCPCLPSGLKLEGALLSLVLSVPAQTGIGQ